MATYMAATSKMPRDVSIELKGPPYDADIGKGASESYTGAYGRREGDGDTYHPSLEERKSPTSPLTKNNVKQITRLIPE